MQPNIFLCVMLVAKCLPKGLSCSFFITICVYVVKHHCSLLFWPILYNSQFFNVKGFTFLTNLCFIAPITCPQVVMFSKILLNYSIIQALYKTNLHLWFDHAHLWVLIFSNLDNAFATTWILPSLYTIMKSYSRNNNNHLVILPKTYGLLTK